MFESVYESLGIMDSIILKNFLWMSWNTFLALVGLLFSLLIYKYRDRGVLKKALVIPWILFVPNSIYILTDIHHLFDQWSWTSGHEKIIILIQFFILISSGLIIYLFSVSKFDQAFKFSKLKRRNYLSIVYLGSILISFGVFMGRIQRTNSWYVISNPVRVLEDAWMTFSDLYWMSIIIIFGIGIAVLYLYTKKHRFFQKLSASF